MAGITLPSPNPIKTAMQKLIFKGNKDIHLWWVDDCFTANTLEVIGGNVPHADLGQWNENSNSFDSGVTDEELAKDDTCRGDNGQVYVHLKAIAERLDISLRICSFEYADSDWTALDKQNSVILLDIGYHKKSDTHGIELWLTKLKQKMLTARLRFFTGNPERVAQYCVTNGVEPETPPCMAKTAAITPDGLDSKSRIQRLIEAHIASQPTELGHLDAAEWEALRLSTHKVADSYGTENTLGAEGGWVHHLPGGGDYKLNYKYAFEGTQLLRTGSLHPVTKVPLQVPDHLWTGAPRWKFPPLRAIAQRTPESLDLSRFFHHLSIDAMSRATGRVHIAICYPAGAFKHDYLWFNVVALGEGLIRLSDGFVGEMIKASTYGRVMWAVREVVDGDNKGVEVVVRQFVELDFPETESTNAGKVNRGQIGLSPCGVFVPKALSTKSIAEAHEYFKNAGALVTGIDDDKDWRLFINATETHGVWIFNTGGEA